MFIQKKRNALIASILTVAMVLTAFPEMSYGQTQREGGESAEETNISEQVVTEEVAEDDAVTDENTENSTTFDLGGNEKMLVMYGGEVRFEDEDGNLVDYDPELTRVKEEESLTGENEYNQDGIRISKKEGGSAKYYYYDRGNVASTKSGSDITSCNVIGIEGNVIGTVRDEENIEKYYVYNKDIQGSTISITAEDGSIAASYDYSDFGVATERQESSIENEICYTGAIYDATTSLYYMNARYYDPSTGRFISEDTYRGEDNNYDEWHLYAYCANNPINYVDPSGHKSIMSIYYNYYGGSGGFKEQAYHSYYYYDGTAIMKAVNTKGQFKKTWKSIGSGVKDLYIYMHGGKGKLYFKDGDISAKTLKKYNKKKKLEKIVLLSCNGGKGEKESVAYALYVASGKKAKVYASKVSISYRTSESGQHAGNHLIYIPRYTRAYCEKYGYSYAYKNPVKRIY